MALLGIGVKQIVAFAKKHKDAFDHAIEFNRDRLSYTTTVYAKDEVFSESETDFSELAEAILEMVDQRHCSCCKKCSK